jgi:hypothetical protein
MRSVWSRLWEDSLRVVLPEASIPAISTHDFTCALATGTWYSIPCSCAPRTRSGGTRSSRAWIPAPIIASGSTTRSTGRRRSDSSPSRIHSPPGWPASHPGSSRSSVPELPTSRRPPVASSAACSPTPRISTLPESSPVWMPAPIVSSAFSVDCVSSE